ncbi:AMP-binding protein [Mesorhizobium sp. RMAD-H1]|uniref:AMP-binding protein n=1 Tax=Mesorhizobium sp. RMAD-H1 TaxID=2587065 RepID=UPI00160EE8D8|nr:AMP-binding protein [Mesorhizobium sp. RMAD-H1]MBB2971309.1 acyl-CoA synthetase (AMP-forming)/AMP-acid ligase II/peptidoglycan/LPS O-acetylase OafA/YrhL [Mesorhizobium sp. RMAD-H1]
MRFVDGFGGFADAPALIFPGQAPLTYAELARRVDALAESLGERKRLILLEAHPSEHAIITYLAALKGGHAIALLPSGDLEAMGDFEADFRPDTVFRYSGGRWRRHDNSAAPQSRLHPDLAVLLATSGSTGKSRFVRLSSANINANAAAIGTYLELQPDDRAALILPFHYSYGLSVLNSHLAAGASVFVSNRSITNHDFIDDIREAGCTNIPGVPYSYELMEQTDFRGRELPRLRFMTVAGGRLSPELVQRYHAHLSASGKRFYVMYGQTEATARIAYVPQDRLADKPDSIGIAVPGGSLGLVDEHGRTIEAANEPGELVYRGPNVMMGYATCPADLARGHDVEELRTGDIAERDADGFYRIVGRLKRMSKIAGLRINHEALEHALSRHGIAAAVVGDDERLLAAFTSGQSADRVRRILIEASGLTPLHVEAVALEALPRLPSGKIDYMQLRLHLSRERPQHHNNVEDAFRRAFYPRPVRPQDSFMSLGGDSLLYVQLSLSLEKALGRIPEAWEHQPISSLSGLRLEKTSTHIIGTELVLRALAILLVVVHHATAWPLPGGAALLMVLVGYGLARFQGSAFCKGDVKRLLRPLGANLMVYYPIVIGYSLAAGHVLWPSVFLVGNLGFGDPAKGTMVPFLYWFVEAYAQIVLIWIGLFCIPAVRRMAKQKPFEFGLAFLAVAVAAKFLVPMVWHIGGRRLFTMPDVLYLAVFGWCIFYARTREKRLALAIIAAGLFPLLAYTGGNWTGSWVKYGLQFFCTLLLLFLPRIALPKGLVRLILPVSAASYHIYLFHIFAQDFIEAVLKPSLPSPLLLILVVTGGIAIGLAIYRLQKYLVGRLSRTADQAGTENLAGYMAR